MKIISFLCGSLLVGSVIALTGCGPKYTIEAHNGYSLVHNKGGQTLGYARDSGVTIITDKGYAFKDLNRNGELDGYEDWRLSVEERIADLAKQMTIEQMAGLMLYSGHQAIPVPGRGYFAGTYNGKQFEESGANPDDLSDQQKKFLSDDHLRHVLITSVESPAIAARWNNNVQSLVEGIGLGIPVNISSDPRHRSNSNAEYNAGAGGRISMWPGNLGIAASFNPDLATDMARAYVDGFQTSAGTDEIKDGWGFQSVNPMVFSEVEPVADAILIHMGVQDQSLMDIISGAIEPSGLLPFQMPAHMTTVEQQYEDVPRDMTCYTDSEGNTYDFAYGLNWSGVINDSRVSSYK